MERRIITTQLEENENVLENHLRPQYLSEYIGQEKAKEILKVYIEAAKKRKEALDHVLLYGPPGLGKTTLAGIIANEMGSNIKITSGPALRPDRGTASRATRAAGDPCPSKRMVPARTRSVCRVCRRTTSPRNRRRGLQGSPSPCRRCLAARRRT